MLCVWHRLVQQLQALKVKLESKDRHTRHVSFGMRHRANETAANKIVGHRHDRYAGCCALCGVRNRCRYCEDYIGACAHQLVSHRIQCRRGEATAIDLKIGALYKTAGSEFLKSRTSVACQARRSKCGLQPKSQSEGIRVAACDRAPEPADIAHAPPTSLMKSRRFMSPRALQSVNYSRSILHWGRTYMSPSGQQA